jgi:hypothetical protein
MYDVFLAVSTIAGCWEDVKPLLKIGVERCGCNSASTVRPFAIFSFAATIVALFAWMLF